MLLSGQDLAAKRMIPRTSSLASTYHPVQQKLYSRRLRLSTRQRPSRQLYSSTPEKQYLIPPDKRLEVDKELWELLDICTDEELESIHDILYGEFPTLVWSPRMAWYAFKVSYSSHSTQQLSP